MRAMTRFRFAWCASCFVLRLSPSFAEEWLTYNSFDQSAVTLRVAQFNPAEETKWQLTGLWHWEDKDSSFWNGRLGFIRFSKTDNNEANRTYDTGKREIGYAISPPFTLEGSGNQAWIYCRQETEFGDPGVWNDNLAWPTAKGGGGYAQGKDVRRLEIALWNAALRAWGPWQVVGRTTMDDGRFEGGNLWVQGLDGFAGVPARARIRLVFDTMDAANNKYKGWIVDGIYVVRNTMETDWSNLNIYCKAPPAVWSEPGASYYSDGAWTPDRLNVLWIEADGKIKSKWTQLDGKWSAPVTHNGLLADPNFQPAVASRGSCTDVAVVGQDGNLWIMALGYDHWAKATDLQGRITSPPAMVMTEAADGSTETFVAFRFCAPRLNGFRIPSPEKEHLGLLELKFDADTEMYVPAATRHCPWGPTKGAGMRPVLATDGSNSVVLADVLDREQDLGLGLMALEFTRGPGGSFDGCNGLVQVPAAQIPHHPAVTYYGGDPHIVYASGSEMDALYHLRPERLIHPLPQGQERVYFSNKLPFAKTTRPPELTVRRNKLRLTYVDIQNKVRVARFDNADPRFPWVDEGILNNGISRYGVRVATARTMEKFAADAAEEIFAVNMEDVNKVKYINLNRSIYRYNRFAQVGLHPTYLEYCFASKPRTAMWNIPVYGNFGYLTECFPEWLMDDLIVRYMDYLHVHGGYADYDPDYQAHYRAYQAETPAEDVRPPVLFLDILPVAWRSRIINGRIYNGPAETWSAFAEELSHAVTHAVKDLGLEPEIPAVSMSAIDEFCDDEYLEHEIMDEHGRVRRGYFQGGANHQPYDYDNGIAGHCMATPLLNYFARGQRFREWMYDDLARGDDLLQVKYDWIRSNIFRGREFGDNNAFWSPMQVVP